MQVINCNRILFSNRAQLKYHLAHLAVSTPHADMLVFSGMFAMTDVSSGCIVAAADAMWAPVYIRPLFTSIYCLHQNIFASNYVCIDLLFTSTYCLHQPTVLCTLKHCSASAGLCEVQVYAYTTSELQVAILRLFVRAECRLPNLFVGTLTRESVTQALEFGVQADQIVSFLRQHAHPHVLHKVPIVPEVCAALCYLHNPHHSDSMAQTGFIARP